MDVPAEITHWVPPSLVAVGFLYLVRREVTRVLSDLDALKNDVRRALTETDKRVTVDDHRQSMKQLWEARNRDREEFIELRTMVRTQKGGS